MEASQPKMRRSETIADISQSVQPQKKSFRRCYSETSLESMNPATSKKTPKHPLLGIDMSVFIMPPSNAQKDVPQYPHTPSEKRLSPTNSFNGSPKLVPSSPSDIPIPPISKPLLRTRDTGSIQRSASSESLTSMFEKSTIHGGGGRLPQRTQSMENLQSKNPLLQKGATEKAKNTRKRRSGSKRRSGHNQTERSRMLKIRTAITDIKQILEDSGVTVHREKVKILQCALSHMRHLKEVLEESKKRHHELCIRVQQCEQMEEARRQLSLRQRLNFGGMPHMHPVNTHGFNEMDSTLNTTQMNHLDPPNSAHAGSPSKGMLPVNSSALPFAPQDPNQISMQMPHLSMPSLLSSHQHPSMVPMNYDSGPSGRISPTPVHAADGLLESMEPPLKFEEDEDAFNCASPDDMMGFFPTVADINENDDMQLPDLMAMMDSGTPGQTRVTTSIETFLT